MRRKGYRTLNFNNQEWQWMAGKSNIIARNDELSKVYTISYYSYLYNRFGYDHGSISAMLRKRQVSITPSDVIYWLTNLSQFS